VIIIDLVNFMGFGVMNVGHEIPLLIRSLSE
jgi:hypothetical protein